MITGLTQNSIRNLLENGLQEGFLLFIDFKATDDDMNTRSRNTMAEHLLHNNYKDMYTLVQNKNIAGYLIDDMDTAIHIEKLAKTFKHMCDTKLYAGNKSIQT